MKATKQDLIAAGYVETNPGQFRRVQAITEKATIATNVSLPKAKGMNKTEAEFYHMLRQQSQLDGLIHDIKFEHIKLKVGSVKCQYCPDFSAFDNKEKMICYEVKGGHIWDGAKEKFKAAQLFYPHIEFQMWQKKSGNWKQIL